MNFKQNIEKNRLKIKELLERKIGKKKSKIGSSLTISQTMETSFNRKAIGAVSKAFTRTTNLARNNWSTISIGPPNVTATVYTKSN